jgi:hypothetical protein
MDAGPDASTPSVTVRAPGTWGAASPAQPAAEFLDAEMHRLLGFAEGAWALGGGFGMLDDAGRLRPEQPIETGQHADDLLLRAGLLVGREGDADASTTAS